MSQIEILPFHLDHQKKLSEHFKRHRAESGKNSIHFMPFSPDDPDGPRGITVDKAFQDMDQPGWQRWFCAHETETGFIIGHVDLKSDPLRASLHRCELGIGIEAPYRNSGLGRRLMLEAISYVRHSQTVEWIDLRVFANNKPAMSLYKNMGFIEVGTLIDRFRIDSQSIDDVIMTLHVPDHII